VTVEFLDFATGRVKQIAEIEGQPAWSSPSLSVSPSGQWILYTLMEQRGSDIMLADNFH
jgi:hypothetical protein